MTSGYVNLNDNPEGDSSYSLQKFLERFETIMLWLGNWDYSVNDQNPPVHWYKNSKGEPVSPSDPEAVPMSFTPRDVAGPYTANEKQALRNFVNEAHRQGVRVIVYMTPQFFYTSEPDTLLQNLQQNIDEFNIDGVYFDGYYQNEPLKTLELVRKTRNLLGDRFYVQHQSWANTLILRSDHFRVPFYDAYADRIWLGEGVKKVDDDTWLLNYC